MCSHASHWITAITAPVHLSVAAITTQSAPVHASAAWEAAKTAPVHASYGGTPLDLGVGVGELLGGVRQGEGRAGPVATRRTRVATGPVSRRGRRGGPGCRSSASTAWPSGRGRPP